MPAALTCPCGAHFESADEPAEREVYCPDCRRPVRAPTAPPPLRKTSLLALASVVLALAGAFTVIGSGLAVLLGLVALVAVARDRERLAGTGLAAFAVVAGSLFTAATVFALTSADLFGLAGWMPGNFGLDGVDTTGPLEVVVPEKGFAITRPSPRWGRFEEGFVAAEAVGQIQHSADVKLVLPGRHAYVDATAEDGAAGQGLDQCQTDALAALNGGRGPGALGLGPRATLRNWQPLPAERGLERRELLLELRVGRETWTLLMRLHRDADGDVYVTRAYARQNRFAREEAELRRALDSFRVLAEGR